MHRRRAVLVVLALLSAACTGGEEPAETPSPTEEDGTAELQSLASGFEEAEARVAYTLASESTDEAQEGRLALSWQPSDGRWRMDFDFEERGDVTVISTGGETAVCDNDEAFCFRLPPDQQAPIPIPLLGEALRSPETFGAVLAGPFSEAEVETSSRTIAERGATCFSSAEEETSVEVCLSEDGLLLGWTFESAEGTSTLEATEVGGIEDDAFEPPYPVQEFPEETPSESPEEPGSPGP